MSEMGATTLVAALSAAVLTLLATALVLAVRGRGFARVYWLGCAVLIVGGAALAAGTLYWPPEEFDDAGNLIGEMPPAFAAALMLFQSGVAAMLVGLPVRWMTRAFGRRKPTGSKGGTR
ncbi:hypothetical protein [Azospirillum sp. TSO35-2]|uniref:hypothetical protein n=1 Tax=Azospirillum sp. TSO35-2 TaxID=716796 RepID=UPI000D615318|nr:hypothetical protein [Azospirillum sp. TSO35-2]PWC33481.1 hypothetical protein TSO352_23800 [Azospirillum sp. TSO35-2]